MNYGPKYFEDDNATATLACQTGKMRKRLACSCPPCAARVVLFGTNIVGIPKQEEIRAARALQEAGK